jgi:hypothetical protein
MTWHCQCTSIESASFKRLATHPGGGPSPRADRPFCMPGWAGPPPLPDQMGPAVFSEGWKIRPRGGEKC